MHNNHHAVQAFLQINTQANIVSESAALEIEKFVCAMYDKPTFSNTNKVRYEIFESWYKLQILEKTKSVHNGVDSSLVPPCRTSLRKHCQRANYQAYLWRHAHVAQMELPSPDGCGWKLNNDGGLLVVCYHLLYQCAASLHNKG